MGCNGGRPVASSILLMICALFQALFDRSLAMTKTSKSLAATAFPSMMLPKGTTSATPRTFLADLLNFLTMLSQFSRTL